MPALVSARAAKKGKGLTKAAVRKMTANNRVIDTVMSEELDDSHHYARITKALGNGQMRIKLVDGSETIGTIRGALRGGGPTRMSVDDVVIVEGDEETRRSKKPVYQIVAVLDTRQITHLRKAGEIPVWMTLHGDAAAAATAAAGETYVFEGEDEEEEDEEDTRVGKKDKTRAKEARRAAGGGGGAAAGAAADDDDFDVADI